jgi:hypothetical protein
LHNMNKVNSTVVAARSRVPILQEQVEPHERVSYRFFPTPKEVLIWHTLCKKVDK